jgi:MerR family transcriptional regulator, light-induced transcriptional regulator
MNTENNTDLPISAVERETGLSKDVLRKWESRYGFPQPLRDSLGERVYPPHQVARLRLIKRLMDSGLRPSRLVGLTDEALQALAPAPHGKTKDTPSQARASLDLIRQDNADGLRRALARDMMQQGLTRFVLDTLAPLNDAVGEAWARGELNVHQEHVYSEAVQWLLRTTIAQLTEPSGRPRVLLTTLPEEQHGLGILMAATLFTLEGAHCISLGTQTPVQVIAEAARAHGVDVVALSFSAAYPSRRILPALEELRQQLPSAVDVCAGGAGIERLRTESATVRLQRSLEDAVSAIRTWQSQQPTLHPLHNEHA